MSKLVILLVLACMACNTVSKEADDANAALGSTVVYVKWKLPVFIPKNSSPEIRLLATRIARILNPLSPDINEAERNPVCCFWLGLERPWTSDPQEPYYFVLIQKGGAICTATDINQLEKSIEHLEKVARQTRGETELPLGLLTNLPTSLHSNIRPSLEIAKIGILDFKQASKIQSNPMLVALEKDRQELLRILPEQFQKARSKAETLQEQIWALPAESILRQEKQRLLIVVREELLQHHRWDEHILWGREILKEWSGELMERAKALATQEGFDVIFAVNRPEINQVSGAPEFTENSDLLVARVNGARVVNVTERVLSRTAER